MMTEKEMKKRRLRLLLGVGACVLMMISDLLWKVKGNSPVSTTLGAFADTAWLDIATWRLVLSNILTAAAVPLYFIGFTEMYQVIRERAFSKLEKRLAMLFRVGVIAGTIAFLFIHTLCVSMPMILKLMEPQLGAIKAAELTNRYMMLNITPMIGYFIAADGVISVVTAMLVWKKTLPFNRLSLLCNPLCTAALGSILAMLPWPLSLIDAISEPCGHLLIVLLGLAIVSKDSRRMPHRRSGKDDGEKPPILNLDDEPDSDVTVI